MTEFVSSISEIYSGRPLLSFLIARSSLRFLRDDWERLSDLFRGSTLHCCILAKCSDLR